MRLGLLTVLVMAACGARGKGTEAAVRRPAWVFQPGAGHLSDPVIDAGRVYVQFRAEADSSSPITQLVAVQEADGQVLWKAPVRLAGLRRSQGNLTIGLEVLAAAGMVYFNGPDEKLHALDGQTGQEKWAQGPVFSALAAGPEGVYVLGADRYLTLLDGRTGAVRSRLPFEGSEATVLTLTPSRLVLGGTILIALDRATGKVVWKFDPQLPASEFLLTRTSASLVLAALKGGIKALDLQTGREVWTMKADAVPGAADDNSLYYVAYDEKLKRHAVHSADLSTGALRAVLPIPGAKLARFSGLTVGNGQLYVVRSRPHGVMAGFSNAQDSSLCGVSQETGSAIWCSDWQYEYTSQPVVSGGSVYVSAAGEGGRPASLYRFEADSMRARG